MYDFDNIGILCYRLLAGEYCNQSSHISMISNSITLFSVWNVSGMHYLILLNGICKIYHLHNYLVLLLFSILIIQMCRTINLFVQSKEHSFYKQFPVQQCTVEICVENRGTVICMWRGQHGAQQSTCKTINFKTCCVNNWQVKMHNQEGSKKQTKQQSMVSPCIKNEPGKQSPVLCLLKQQVREKIFSCRLYSSEFVHWQQQSKKCASWMSLWHICGKRKYELNCKKKTMIICCRVKSIGLELAVGVDCNDVIFF